MIQFVTPDVGESELAAVKEAFSEGRLSTGEIVSVFEEKFAPIAGREYAAAVCSGSVALELAFEVSDLEPGDRVLVSPFNCSAVLYSIRRKDLIPVFADISLETFNLSPETTRRRLESTDTSIQGLLLTHLYGQTCNMGTICDLADEYDLTMIDDFSQAPGAMYGSDPAGSFGTFGVCSFGATKNITTGEGGIIVTDHHSLIDDLRARRNNNGVDADPPPRSVRMSDIEAAIGRVQIERYQELVKTRRSIAEIYYDSLPDDIDVQKRLPNTEHVYHRFPIRTYRRDALQEYLQSNGIETAPVIETPLYEFQCAPSVAAEDYPNTTRAVKEGLHLPVHSRLSEKDAIYVSRRVREFFE